LLKGGPGSGKSTITLYCIKSLLDCLLQQESIFKKARPFKILYTTYTNSLVRVSEHLLKELEAYNSPHNLTVMTVDSMASKYLPYELKKLNMCKKNEDLEEIMIDAIEKYRDKIKQFSFTNSDRRFLVEEIDWVIIGQDLKNVDDYLYVDRAGRGRALGKQQRFHLWNLYEEFIELLRQKDMCLFSERLRYAANHVKPDYDYVFIDEAQDLKPVAIRFLMGLCNNRKNVYLTADVNQSIWGYSFSWKKMSEDLDVRGRAKVLRRNYRTVKEIWDAIMQIAPDSDTADRETLQVDTVYRGKVPILSWYEKQNQIKERINSYLFEALLEERTTPKSAAVLCPTSRETEYVLNMIDHKFKPKIMKSSEVDIAWPGVKILTMHAAKGLEFPIVAVVGLEQGRLPLPAMAGIDKDEHYAQQRRLLFVACSRAMRRLIVFANKERPSPFVKPFTDEKWVFEHLDRFY
jgi:superfamily I DNA/RNA helicase